jgi:phage terminase large subunit-like protein
VSVAVPDWLAMLAGLPDETLTRLLRNTPAPLRRRLFEEWSWQAHGGQRAPDETGQRDDWRVWLILAGRGFGKTRAGAEWVWARARATPAARIALVGASLDEVARVMIEGESGLIAAARTDEAPRWRPSLGVVDFPSGAIGLAYSGARPDKLRGPQHHFAWCDEIAKWAHGEAAWDNLMLGMRLGARPRTIVTTTPRPVPVLRRILDMEGMIATGGATGENVHLPRAYLDAMRGLFEGTRLGRQELEGKLIDEAEGSLWPRALIERCRDAAVTPAARGRFCRVLIGLDPPASAHGDACGIVVCALDADGVGHVLDDASASGLSPDGWAARTAAAAARWQVDRVIAEANQGGEMIESVLRAADRDLPLRLVHARMGKTARAEPVATLFERGRARFAGAFPALEDELAGLCAGGRYEGPGRSPDRADAMIWAMAELMLGRRARPRVAGL